MIDHLSPRECDELERILRSGLDWPRVIRSCYLDGTRLRLGSDLARSEKEIAAAAGIDPKAVRRVIADAARFCQEHGLHLLGYDAGDRAGGWHHFLAVG